MLHVPLFDASQLNQVRRPLQLWRKVSGSNRRPVASMLQPARARLHTHAEHSTLPTETPSRFVYAGQLDQPPSPIPRLWAALHNCQNTLPCHPLTGPTSSRAAAPASPPHTHHSACQHTCQPTPSPPLLQVQQHDRPGPVAPHPLTSTLNLALVPNLNPKPAHQNQTHRTSTSTTAPHRVSRCQEPGGMVADGADAELPWEGCR